MANQPGQTSVFTVNGYAVFGVKDSSGNAVAPFGNYVWNPNVGTAGLWVPAPVDASGVPQVSLSGSNTISGMDVVSIATANTAQQLPNVSAKQYVTLVGLKGNTGTVYVGMSSSVSNTAKYGYALDPKDTCDIDVTNLDLLWIYGNAGDGVSYVAL